MRNFSQQFSQFLTNKISQILTKCLLLTKTINLYHSMKRYLKFGIFSLVVFASVFFSRKAERSNVQNVILLNNVEALAAGENPTTRCIGTGSVDCSLNHEK